MSLGWDSLPLLPLKCVLEHLSTEDALAAMSTCRHWRTGLLLYEGHKETLKLSAKSLDKDMFLTKLFRKHIKQLHIYLECNEEQLEKFLNYVLPQFFDAVNLQEILFIGPTYIQLSQHVAIKLKRIVTESLVFKHLHSLKKLGFMGCELVVKNENEKYTHRNVEYYPRSPLLSNTPPADAILRCDVNMMKFSTLQHIIVDYDQINTEAIETLSNLSKLSYLSLNLFGNTSIRPLLWAPLKELFQGRLSVAVNIISLPYRKFHEVIENVLVEGLPLISLKVMFCKTIYVPLIEHVVRKYHALQEMVWADCPAHSEGRAILCRQSNLDMCEINPFMMVCWQCPNLQRLAIHGYWLWQYDVVGFIRLRSSIRHLEISSVYDRTERLMFTRSYGVAYRVLVGDSPVQPNRKFMSQVNEFSDFRHEPCNWSTLPAGLRARCSAEQRARYVTREVTAAPPRLH
ncbi:F-box only protein 33 [Plodia interpunctella]|uniref:F-box only protein 33 n=1 Tax=Plodia interpunctella TaxID=58824 RepID=UPI002367C4F3|nr:F-box only protein 33 [Plodia interpunctella]